MTEQRDRNDQSLLEMTADIVSAYVSNNPMPSSDLSILVADVHRSLATLHAGAPEEPITPTPAVPIKKSVHPNHLVCLEDGRTFKSLKRHLASSHNLTPDEYRARWKLPSDYPMVSPNYAAERAELAKKMGLGRKPVAKPAAPPARRRKKPQAD